jgi:hypothetical protein
VIAQAAFTYWTLAAVLATFGFGAGLALMISGSGEAQPSISGVTLSFMFGTSFVTTSFVTIARENASRRPGRVGQRNPQAATPA